jgi:hypothetical protein
MTTYYYKRNEDWYVTKDFTNQSGQASWIGASSVIQVRHDGHGQFIKGSRQDLVECQMRKYAAKDIIYKEEMLGLALRAQFKNG